MRSGTCRMLKLNTNVSVPFLIYAVTCWCGLLPQNLDWNTKQKIIKNERRQKKKNKRIVII